MKRLTTLATATAMALTARMALAQTNIRMLKT